MAKPKSGSSNRRLTQINADEAKDESLAALRIHSLAGGISMASVPRI
jgi:hypothetical protein